MTDHFPVESFKEAAEHLRRPFAPQVVRFKVQAQWPKEDPRNGLIVSYVDARTVSERLSYVVGDNWESDIEPWASAPNAARCRLTLFGKTRSDVGKGGAMESEKAASSDALKRAAIHWGPGAYLYKLAAITLRATESGEMQGDKPTLLVKSKGNKKVLELTPACEEWLRSNYSRWVDSARNDFGPVLDHGDEEGAIGDPVEHPVPAEAEDVELADKKQEAEAFYANLNGDKAKYPEGKFNSQLAGAKTVTAIDGLIEKVRKAVAA